MSFSLTDKKYHFKVILIGDSGVGKTSLLDCSQNDVFEDFHIPTIGIDYRTIQYKVDDTVVKLSLWDCAGQERFRVIVRNYFKGSDAVLMMYDLTNKDSFRNIDRWMNECLADSSPLAVVLVGNKSDLVKDREVSYREASVKAKLLGMDTSYEVSVKRKDGINEVLGYLAHTLKKIEDVTPRNPKETIVLGESEEETGSSCCFGSKKDIGYMSSELKEKA